MAQTLEVVEGNHLQVWSGKSVRQLLADGFQDAYPRQLLYALAKTFLLALGSLLRRRLIAGHTIVNVAFFGLAKIEDAASTFAVDENSGPRVGALPFCFGFPY